METAGVYERLREHLDRGPAPYPATKSGVELRILRHLFSEEDARIALELSALPESIGTIHKRLREFEAAELERKLEDMAERGLILAMGDSGKRRRYGKLPFVVGIYERQLGRLTPELERDVREYSDEALGEALYGEGRAQMRTVPVEKSIPVQRNVATYDDIRSFVREAPGPFAAMDCICRKGKELTGEQCKQTRIRQNCLMIGNAAEAMVEMCAARPVSREEMLDLLDAADREGLVLQPENTTKPLFVCCCCGCCCGVLTTLKKFPKPAELVSANYYAAIDEEQCGACGTCLERCQMDAIRMETSAAEVVRERCIGCGLCVTTCPSEAVHLHKKEEAHAPPKDTAALYLSLLKNRYGPLRFAGALSGYLAGRKF